MALVGKSGGETDGAERIIGGRQFPRCEIDSQPAHILANRAPKVFAKEGGEMDGMHPGQFPKFIVPQSFAEAGMQKFLGLPEPARRFAAGPRCDLTRQLREDFQCEAFDSERRCFIGPSSFLMQSQGEPRGRATADKDWFGQREEFADALQSRRRNFKDQAMNTIPEIIGMG